MVSTLCAFRFGGPRVGALLRPGAPGLQTREAFGEEGSGEAFRAVLGGSYTSDSKQERSCCDLDHCSPQTASIRCGRCKRIEGFTAAKQLQGKSFLQRLTLL